MLTRPETICLEHRKVLLVFGAELVPTKGAIGIPGTIARAPEIYDFDPRTYFLSQQFKNPAIHEKPTGAEIWQQTGGGRARGRQWLPCG